MQLRSLLERVPLDALALFVCCCALSVVIAFVPQWVDLPQAVEEQLLQILIGGLFAGYPLILREFRSRTRRRRVQLDIVLVRRLFKTPSYLVGMTAIAFFLGRRLADLVAVAPLASILHECGVGLPLAVDTAAGLSLWPALFLNILIAIPIAKYVGTSARSFPVLYVECGALVAGVTDSIVFFCLNGVRLYADAAWTAYAAPGGIMVVLYCAIALVGAAIGLPWARRTRSRSILRRALQMLDADEQLALLALARDLPDEERQAGVE